MLEGLRRILQTNLDLDPSVQAKLLQSLLIILVLVLMRIFLLRLVNRRFHHDARNLYTWRKATEYFVVLVGFLLVGRIWLQDIQSLATYLGLLSAGIAIALQDLIVNIAGWAFIIWRRPFAVGDRIEVGAHAGDVVDVSLFTFSLLEIAGRIEAEQSTGRVIHVPNGRVLREPIVNYSHGLPHIWNEIPVLVTFESDWEKAKTLLEQLLQQHAPTIEDEGKQYGRHVSSRFVISYGNIAPIVYTKVSGSGVLLTMRYLVAPRQRRNSEQTIWEGVLRAFGRHVDIDFAYETYREFRHWREGKPAIARPEQAPTAQPAHDHGGEEHD
jgi:small-conductance mechanosensitive channel